MKGMGEREAKAGEIHLLVPCRIHNLGILWGWGVGRVCMCVCEFHPIYNLESY